MNLFVLLAAVIVILPACDLIIAPLHSRTNPYDPNTTIQPPYNASARWVQVNSEWGIMINWEWSNSDAETEVAGYVIVRKSRSVPASVYDGRVVGFSDNTENMSIFEPESELSSDDYGWKTYYGVFSYAPKWPEEQMDEDEKITYDESGSVINIHNYDFNGPAVADCEIWKSADIPVSADGHIDGGSNWSTGGTFLQVHCSSSAADLISFITFDLSAAPSGNVELAQFILTNNTTSTNGTMDIFSLDQNWDGINFTTANAATAFRYWTIDITSGNEDVFTVDITDTFNDWSGGVHVNNGLKLITNDGSQDYVFSSSEGPNPPVLRIWYWNY